MDSDYAVLHPDNALDASLKGIVDQKRFANKRDGPQCTITMMTI